MNETRTKHCARCGQTFQFDFCPTCGPNAGITVVNKPTPEESFEEMDKRIQREMREEEIEEGIIPQACEHFWEDYANGQRCTECGKYEDDPPAQPSTPATAKLHLDLAASGDMTHLSETPATDTPWTAEVVKRLGRVEQRR